MELRIDSRSIAGGGTARGLVGHGRALVQCADSRAWQGLALRSNPRGMAVLWHRTRICGTSRSVPSFYAR